MIRVREFPSYCLLMPSALLIQASQHWTQILGSVVVWLGLACLVALSYSSLDTRSRTVCAGYRFLGGDDLFLMTG